MESIDYLPMDAKSQEIIDSIHPYPYIREYMHHNYNIWVSVEDFYGPIDTTSNFVFTKKYIIYLDKIYKEYMIRKLKPAGLT